MTKPKGRAFRWRALFACILIGPALILAVFSPPLVVEGSVADVILDTLAWLVFLAGAILRFWSTLHIGGQKGRAVVSDGPYSLCRHPLYVGTLLLAISGALFLDDPIVLLAVMVLGGVYAAVTIPSEERFMVEELGEDYSAYCRQTPRLIPRLGNFQSPEFLQIKMKALWLELKRGFLWLFLPVGCEILSALRLASWWPHPLTLPWL